MYDRYKYLYGLTGTLGIKDKQEVGGVEMVYLVLANVLYAWNILISPKNIKFYLKKNKLLRTLIRKI